MPCYAKGFSDISSSHWALNGINYVSDNGYMDGTSTTAFSPNTAMTRAMFVTVLYARAGKPTASTSNKFTDVSSSAYYAAAVTWAYNNGITGGTSDTTFSPNATVTRQDGMLMYYKFASYRDADTTYSSSALSGYTDTSSVASYALTAMKWAVTHGLIASTSTTAQVLSPTASITRAQMAVILTNYGTNVEKIIFSTDVYKFTNHSSIFSTTCYIDDSDYSLLRSLVTEKYPSTYSSLLKMMNDQIYETSSPTKRPWVGSCYGMCATVILDKMGYVDINRNFPSTVTSASTLGGLGLASIRGTALESAINFYQLAQSLPDAQEYVTTTVANAYNYVNNNKGLSILGLYWIENGETYGHAVAAYSASISNGRYVFKVYNPNHGASVDTITITPGGVATVASESTSYSLSQISVGADFSVFGDIDIDGYTNQRSTTSATSLNLNTIDEIEAAESESTDWAYLYVELNGNFDVINDNGETLSWDGTALSGDMDYGSYHFILRTLSPAMICISIPASSSYTVTSQTEDAAMYFNIVDANGYARVSGEGITSAIVEDIDQIEVIGTDIIGEFVFSLNEDESLHCVDSIEENVTSVEISQGNVYVNGDLSADTVQAVDVYTGSLVSE